jgi:hypothetical protein
MQNLHQSMWDREILYADRSSNSEQLLATQFLWKIKKYECGRQLNVKINILFYGDNSWIVILTLLDSCNLVQ